jgi:phospholipase/carboxylesterase
VSAAIDDASRQLNISSSRVFIGGEGCGGTMAFRLGFSRPEWFAGVLSLNGELPSGFNPLARLNACRRLPVFWTQCRRQSAFDEGTLGQNLRLLHAAGFNLTLRQYPSGDQRASMLADANRWIMELVTRPAASPA